MNKPSFSFVKWLTKRDVEKILEKNGYEINYNLPSPYSKFKGDDGYYYIFVKCTKKISTEMEKDLNIAKEFMSKKSLCIPFDFFNKNHVLLEFSDFMLTEQLVAYLDENEAININKNLTRTYQNYMKEKFGSFYVNMKKAYIKKLYQEDKNDKETEKEEK